VIVHVVTDQPLDDGQGTDLVGRLALAFPGPRTGTPIEVTLA
jgi:hypothetical protein